MNLKKLIIAPLAALTLTIGASAQDSSSSAVMRRGGDNARGGRNAQTESGVSERLKSFYEDGQISDADMLWMRVIYRQLDLNNPKNATLYFPEDLVDGNENLFRMILRVVADGSVPAYEYLDGREIFTDQYRLNVADMLDRFHIPFSEAKGSTEKSPKFAIEEFDVPTNEVLSYYILERWELDSRNNRTTTRVEAICPVLHRSGDFGGDAMKYPMFWVKLENLRPYMAQQYIFTDDNNNLAKYTYDDFFAMNMYDGEIYKTRNLMNKSMVQLYPDPDDLKRAQDSIQQRLQSFDKHLWVPTREELEARREAEAAAAEAREAANDSIAIPDRDTKKSSVRKNSRSRDKSSSSSSSSKSKKVKEPKGSKSSSSSSAVRSVRRNKK